MAGVDRVYRPGEPAGKQVAQQQGADAAGVVAGPHHGDRPGAQEGRNRYPCRRALVGQQCIKVGICFLHGEAGVHARRRHLLLILQSQFLQHAQHRDIAPGHVTGQPPHPRVAGSLSQPAQQQGPQPGAPPAGIDKHQGPGLVCCRALIPRHTDNPYRRVRRDSNDRGRVAGPWDGYVTGTVGRQMSQVGKQAAGAGIQAAPQRLDARGVITAQRPEHHHPAITQRLLAARCAAAGHDPAPGSSKPSGVSAS